MEAVLSIVLISIVFVSAERQPRYSNEWAVEMKNCTNEEADTVAARLGLRNFGKVRAYNHFGKCIMFSSVHQVGSIENVYRFVYEEGSISPVKLTDKTFNFIDEAQVLNKYFFKKNYAPINVKPHSPQVGIGWGQVGVLH